MSPNLAAISYQETMADLKARIEAEHGSVRKFCIKQTPRIDYANLYRAFSVDNPKEMSVGLYIRVAKGLNLPGLAEQEIYPDQLLLNLSLKDYLLINNNAIMVSMFALRFDYEEKMRNRNLQEAGQEKRATL